VPLLVQNLGSENVVNARHPIEPDNSRGDAWLVKLDRIEIVP
jgi:hypothetical protein